MILGKGLGFRVSAGVEFQLKVWAGMIRLTRSRLIHNDYKDYGLQGLWIRKNLGLKPLGFTTDAELKATRAT